MAFAWNKTRCSPIGVDFGTDSLKLLQVVLAEPPQLVAAAAADVPESARANPAARYAFLGDALRDLLRAEPFKGRQAACSIPSAHTLVQHMQIARVEHEDFDAQIGLQLRQRLNVEPSRMVVRHFDVAQVVRDNSPRQEIICLAASREAVMQHVELAKRAKLDVVGMHCEPVVILKAFAHLYRRATDGERTTCFIDFGAGATNVIIAHGATMVFAKTIYAAGDHLTKHRAQAEGISFSAAREARMREAAAPPAAAVQAAGRGGVAVLEKGVSTERRGRGAVAPVAEAPDAAACGGSGSDTLDCLIDELQLCLRYHQSIFPGRTVEKLIFLGGESRHTAMCQKVARALRIGAQLGDPLARLVRTGQRTDTSVDFNRPQPGWAVPMGLCLSDVTT